MVVSQWSLDVSQNTCQSHPSRPKSQSLTQTRTSDEYAINKQKLPSIFLERRRQNYPRCMEYRHAQHLYVCSSTSPVLACS